MGRERFVSTIPELDVLDELYRTRRAALLRLAERIIRDAAEAEDMVQTAFLRAYERCLEVPSDRMFVWLNTVVRRLAIDRVRRGLAQARYVDASQHTSDIEDASRPWWWQLSTGDLQSAISAMPRATRFVFTQWCAGASYATIAAMSSIPLGTVATRILRAKARLRAHFPQEDENA